MRTPAAVEAREGFRVRLRYDDGTEGEVDLVRLAGWGVFAAWDDRSFFEAVRVTPHRAAAWGDDIELCADALYLELTGKSVEDVMPGGRASRPVPDGWATSVVGEGEAARAPVVPHSEESEESLPRSVACGCPPATRSTPTNIPLGDYIR